MGSLPSLRDMAAAFPFAGSTSNEAVHVSQRHTNTHTHTEAHTEDTDMGSYTGCHRQGTTFNSTYVQGSHKTQAQTAKSSPPLQLVAAEVKAHAHDIL